MFVRCSNSSSDILAAAHQNTQTVIDATQKETAIDQQQHSCEMLICQCHQTILRLLSSAATTSTQRQVRELNCLTTYTSDTPACKKTTTINKLKPVRKERLETKVHITSKNLQKYSHTTLATACPHTDKHMQ